MNPFVLGSINKSIYDAGDSTINEAVLKIIKLVAGLGAGAFTLAVLIITLIIIFASISSQGKHKAWMALISCAAGAFVFFSAYYFAPTIASIAG
jgi:hypothetical protein